MNREDRGLAWAHQVPFEVSLSTVTSPQGLFRVGVDFQEPLSEENLAILEADLDTFLAAAARGILAGDDTRPLLLVEPAAARAQRMTLIRHTPKRVECELRGLSTDIRSQLVMLNVLLCFSEQCARIHALRLAHGVASGGGPLSLLQGQRTSYPKPYRQLPFAYENGVSSTAFDAVTLTMRFQRPCSAMGLEVLREGLEAWSELALLGAYISPPLSPDGGYLLQPDEELRIWDSEVQWSVEKYRIDEEALVGLVNLLVAFHERHDKLVEVLIE